MQEDIQERRTPLKISKSPPSHSPSPPPHPRSSPNPPSPPPAPGSSPPPPDFDQDDFDRSSRQTTPLGDNYPPTVIPRIRTTIDFIHLVEEATLASQFDPEELAELLDPLEYESVPPDDPGLKLALLNFISFTSLSQTAYEEARQNIQQCFPDIEILSYYQVERRIQNLSGVITWEHHMCIKSCVGFTGPYVNLEQCPRCGEGRYKEKELQDSNGTVKIPKQVFTTFPVGPQLQARWKHPQTAKNMHYRWERTQELQQERATTGEPPRLYDDILCGTAYLDLVDEGTIGEYDTVLMLSIDGAQLHESNNQTVGSTFGFSLILGLTDATRSGTSFLEALFLAQNPRETSTHTCSLDLHICLRSSAKDCRYGTLITNGVASHICSSS